MDWRTIRKIDAHVHVIPEKRLAEQRKKPGSAWAIASPDEYIRAMDRFNVAHAILMPINQAGLYCDTADETNAWHAELLRRYPGRFYAFADVRAEGAAFFEDAPLALERAVTDYGLCGLKLHPSNLNMDIDCLQMVPVLRKAAELNIPVTVHSNPCRSGFHDNCAPDRINRMIQIFPDVTFITAHMGGMKWPDAVTGCTFVDISGNLISLVNLYGIEQTKRILHRFGAERLIFATDWPDVWFSAPESICETYCDILNRMDFTEAEAEKIAYGNIAAILGLKD